MDIIKLSNHNEGKNLRSKWEEKRRKLVLDVFVDEVKMEEAAYFKHHFEADPWADQSFGLLISSEEDIAASLHIYQREMFVLDIEPRTKVAGVAEVCTKPTMRKQGLASKLLKKVPSLLAEENISISTLGTPITSFYEKFGWQSVPLQYRRLDVSRLPKPEVESSKIGFEFEVVEDPSSVSDELLKEIMEVHTTYNKNFIGPIYRNQAYWREWVFGSHDFSNGKRFLFLVRRADSKHLSAFAMFERQVEEGDDSEGSESSSTDQVLLSELGISRSEQTDDGGKRIFLDCSRFIVSESPKRFQKKLQHIVFASPIEHIFAEPLPEDTTSDAFSVPNYMYRFTDQNALSRIQPDLLSLVRDERSEMRKLHVFWQVDQF